MKLLSLDASTKNSGWAIFEDTTLLAHGCISAASADLVKRIYTMTEGILNILKKYPDIKRIVLEEVRPEQGLQNIKTHKALMYLQAAITFMLHDNFPKVEIIYVYPSAWRKACGIKTGSGIRRETLKPLDIAFVKEKYNIEVNDDEADAIAIGCAQVNVFDSEINWE